MWSHKKPEQPGFYWYRCDWLGDGVVTAEPVQIKPDFTVILLGVEGPDSGDELILR
jgi:hypothetical protein